MVLCIHDTTLFRSRSFRCQEVIDVFHVFFNIPTIEKLSFHLSHVSILGSMKCGKTRNDFLTLMHQKNINLKMIMQKNSAKRPV